MQSASAGVLMLYCAHVLLVLMFWCTGPDNDLWRLNSGFYFLRSEPRSIAALEAVVAHAAKSKDTEQPSFYTVLCGDNGKFRVGDRQCYNPRFDLTIDFLSRKL